MSKMKIMNAKRQKNIELKFNGKDLPQRPMTANKRQRILSIYEKQLKQGASRDDVLKKLSDAYQVNDRTIERWISLARQEKPRAPTVREIGHWNDLKNVAEELLEDLQFPRVYVTTAGATMGENISIKLRYYYDDSRIRLSTEQDPLYSCLMDHLDAEYRAPHKFSLELQRLLDIATELANDKSKDFYSEIKKNELTIDLCQKLTLVINQGTFKGVCSICKKWLRI